MAQPAEDSTADACGVWHPGEQQPAAAGAAGQLLPGGGGELVLGGRTYAAGDDGRLDLAWRELGREAIEAVAELARWLATDAGAALKEVVLDKSMLSGSEVEEPWNEDGYDEIEELDADLSGFKLICEALVSSQIEVVSMKSCYLGSQALAVLAEAIKLMAAMTSVNCLANPIGEEGLATLLSAIEGSSVRSICGLTDGQTTADFSGQNLGPFDCKILASEFGFSGLIGGVTSLS